MVRTCYTEHNTSVTINVKSDEWLKFFPHTTITFIRKHLLKKLPKKNTTKRISSLPKLNLAKLVYYETSDMTDLKREVACAWDSVNCKYIVDINNVKLTKICETRHDSFVDIFLLYISLTLSFFLFDFVY
jgi:hypothetical protein